MSIGFNLHLNGSKIKVEPEELAKYAAAKGLEELIPGRYSSLFVFNLMNLERVFLIDASPVIKEIMQLEGLGDGLQMKPATEFRGSQLKGLWHQHFFVVHPSAMAHNIQNHLGKHGLERLVAKMLPLGEVVTEAALNALTNAIVTESLEKRANAQKLTGEWIVFAKQHGKNYYLSIETHQQSDERVASNLRIACLPQFPFLSEYLTPHCCGSPNSLHGGTGQQR
ncbi:hypothetical protein [Duganella sp. Root1480D1]|uniref:hypothetical protein n=1 Tax=Duganella sp. Root1480D1 TaxID=1736471 RepID=UPI00070A2AAD|nr:hypothetical protein [Duganella sp. Root1480D1]KQZ35115.1 hypothetical protein ASD58_28285 [Duganella sp. Root1480D1]